MPSIYHNRLKQPPTNGHAPSRKKAGPLSFFKVCGINFLKEDGSEAVAECFLCGGEKLYINVDTGAYHCKHCDEGGGKLTLLRHIYDAALEKTTNTHRLMLKRARGIASQRFEHHGFAFDSDKGCWLIPYKNRDGKLVQLQRYWTETGRKLFMPSLGTSLYGLDRLSNDRKKWVLLCEGPFDAIALDYQLKQNRSKYDILAAPGGFSAKWAEHLKGRKVKALFDNDDGGTNHYKTLQKHLDRVAAELRVLRWPRHKKYKGKDINDLVNDGVKVLQFCQKYCLAIPRTQRIDLTMGEEDLHEPGLEWLWPDHLPCGTYASYSGVGGTFKSTVMVDIAARYTTGEKMPDGQNLEIPPGCVLFVTAEDRRMRIKKQFLKFGGDISKIKIIKTTNTGEAFNFMELREDLSPLIQLHGVRLIVLDGQNSLIGNPNYSSDTAARSNISGPLHHFAEKHNIVLVGIRNEDPLGRALGPQSMNDMGRCNWSSKLISEKNDNPKICELQFPKINEAPQQEPLRYCVYKSEKGKPVGLHWETEDAQAKTAIANYVKNLKQQSDENRV